MGGPAYKQRQGDDGLGEGEANGPQHEQADNRTLRVTLGAQVSCLLRDV